MKRQQFENNQENEPSESLIEAIRRRESNAVLQAHINNFADVNYQAGRSTPLGVCFEEENITAFEFLYSHGARLIPYPYRHENDEENKYETEYQRVVDAEEGEDFDTALATCAIQSGKLEFLKYLVKNRKPDLKKASEWSGGAICCACLENQFDIVKYLLENKLQEIEALDDNQWTPLYVSSQEDKSYEITHYLLERGANICWINQQDETALHLAGGPKTQKLLLEKSVEQMEKQDSMKWSQWAKYWRLLTKLYEKKIKPHFSQDLDSLLLFALLTQQSRDEIFGILGLGAKTDLLCQKFGDFGKFSEFFYPSFPKIMEEADSLAYSNLLECFSGVVLSDGTPAPQPGFLDFTGCAMLWSQPLKSGTSSMEVSSDEDENEGRNTAPSKGFGKRNFE